MEKFKKFKRTIEIYPGIYKIVLPFPGKRPGPVNVLLFRGKKNVLVDTGAIHTVAVLEKAFREIGFSFRELDQIIITHGHLDHYGAARTIVRLSGNKTKLCAHPEDIYSIKKGREVPLKTYRKFLSLMGVPFPFIGMMTPLLLMSKFLARNTNIDILLNDGDIVPVGNYFARVISTPGHSKGSICLSLDDEKILVSGDHILEHITPNAFVMLNSKDGAVPSRCSQLEYYRSIEKIEALSPLLTVPAHGKLIYDVRQITAGYRVSFEKRLREITSITKNGRKTVYQIAINLFPGLGGMRFFLELFLAISEVFTHLQVLEKDGNVCFTIVQGVLMIEQCKI